MVNASTGSGLMSRREDVHGRHLIHQDEEKAIKPENHVLPDKKR
jgi:hypothetical protein